MWAPRMRRSCSIKTFHTKPHFGFVVTAPVDFCKTVEQLGDLYLYPNRNQLEGEKSVKRLLAVVFWFRNTSLMENSGLYVRWFCTSGHFCRGFVPPTELTVPLLVTIDGYSPRRYR